jgi:hypothetical protein
MNLLTDRSVGMPERTRQNDSFRAWYDRNGTSYNVARQERYKVDPVIRARARLNAALYRKRVRDEGYVPPPRQGLFTSAGVAAVLKISTQTLRNWEGKGLIPHATHGGKRRRYTATQLKLLQWLLEVRDAVADARRVIVFEQWNTVDD